MCGLAGIVDPRGHAAREPLTEMSARLRHRGPDDSGEWWSGDGCVGLAHRRLAIIDLTAAGHQPMHDDGLTLVFNGEIYNYRALREILEARGRVFASQSDTEVILKAYAEWGEACVTRLDGMFAFALFDARAGRVFLARDRAGEKPLYYYQQGKTLTFASELKALLAVPGMPRAVDPQSLDEFLAYGHVGGARCIIAGVHKLPPAHALTLQIGAADVRVWRYWSPPEEPAGTRRLDDLVDELDEVLGRAVAGQLVADVPLGILLSGGIDSGLIAAAAVRHSTRTVRTFTVTVPGDAQLDEAANARAVSRHLGTEHTELPAESVSLDLLHTLARQYDEPIGDSSIVPTYLVARLIRQHATVALGGDGGDELFAGYPHYQWLLREQQLKAIVPGPLRRAAAHGATRLPVGMRGRNHLIGMADGMASSIAHVNLFFDAATRGRLSPVLRALHGPTAEARRAEWCGAGPLIRQATLTDFQTTLPDGYLVKVDRASMLNSLEVRAPFLDRSMIEFAFGVVPSAVKLAGGRLKAVTRALAARLLPAQISVGPKRGFSVPLSAWLKGEWGSGVDEILGSASPDLLDPAAVNALLARQRAGYGNSQRLFALTMLELWRREYGVAV